MITFHQEPFAKAYRDASAAIARHYDEIAEDKHIIGLIDPDLEYYAALEKRDMLRVLVARDGNKLVGYYIAVISNNKHYKSVLCATEDMYYLDPDYRKGALGLKLLLEAERMLRETKAVISIAKTKISHDHGVLFERIGYRPFERVYCKILER